MNARSSHYARLTLAAVAVLGVAMTGHAFFPYGNFDTSGNLFLYRWPFDELDRNGDGDVSGDNDGIPFTFEGGENGWTPTEIAELRRGFEMWESIPTSFAAFSYTENTEEQLETSGDIGSVDSFNFVAAKVGDDPGDLVAIVGQTFITTIDETMIVEIGGSQFQLTGPRIIDADILIDADVVREGDLAPLIRLDGVAATLSGIAMGLSFNPMDNFTEVTVGEQTLNVEPRVVALRDAQGVLRVVGVTPTMRPDAVFYDDGGGVFTLTSVDLAPDDIAGMSYLYPRGDQGIFFSLGAEARTRARNNFPSEPVAGGLVIAWADADNNAATGRVPMYSTLGGLFTAQEAQRGQFLFPKIFKRLESPQGVLFNASYTFSHHEWTAPVGSREDWDSTHGGDPVTGGAFDGFSYATGYPSEVFNENGNLFGLGNKDSGTPLAYDPIRRKVVSTVSQKAIDQILAPDRALDGPKPMFGDPNKVCFWNQVAAGIAPMQTPELLRAVRDNVLLETALGTALVDMYYRVSPTLVTFMLEHSFALQTAYWVGSATEWSYQHARLLLALTGVLLAFGAAVALRRRKAWAAAGAVGLISALAVMPAADALMLYVSTGDLVKASDDVVVGTVVAVDSHWDEVVPNKIVTDVAIELSDSFKGALNKSSVVHLRQPGGRIGPMKTSVTHVPEFTKGEEVVVFLKYSQKKGYEVASGTRGKYNVKTDAETGVKYVEAPELMAELGLQEVAKSLGEAVEKDANTPTQTRIPLSDFASHIKSLAQESVAQ